MHKINFIPPLVFDITILKASVGMLEHAWPHPPKPKWSIYNFNRFEAACTKSTSYLL